MPADFHVNGHDDLVHQAETNGVERVCGEELRLEEVLARFRKEAVQDTFDTGRYRCRYYTWGSGPPLVFIHGLGDDALSFVLPIARLSEHFRCICYDQPKGGGDGSHLGRYHHADLVQDLIALVDHWQLPQAYLFGSSFGSTIALAAMHERPERFPRGVLHSGFARRPLAPAEEMLASWARYWPWNMSSLPMRETVMTQTHYPPFAARQPELWKFFLSRDGAIPMEAVARRALILNHVDLRSLLPSIRQPILMVVGDQDPLVGKSCEEVLMKGLPNATRAELSGCGHMAQFTHPEVLAEATWRFLRPLRSV
jgi:pimeloyl-ACP methyl ester carboxylesterase